MAIFVDCKGGAGEARFSTFVYKILEMLRVLLYINIVLSAAVDGDSSTVGVSL